MLVQKECAEEPHLENVIDVTTDQPEGIFIDRDCKIRGVTVHHLPNNSLSKTLQEADEAVALAQRKFTVAVTAVFKNASKFCFAKGTGVIIGERTVATSKHIVKPMQGFFLYKIYIYKGLSAEKSEDQVEVHLVTRLMGENVYAEMQHWINPNDFSFLVSKKRKLKGYALPELKIEKKVAVTGYPSDMGVAAFIAQYKKKFGITDEQAAELEHTYSMDCGGYNRLCTSFTVEASMDYSSAMLNHFAPTVGGFAGAGISNINKQHENKIVGIHVGGGRKANYAYTFYDPVFCVEYMHALLVNKETALLYKHKKDLKSIVDVHEIFFKVHYSTSV